MATVLIHAGAACGAMGAILDGRFQTSGVVSNYDSAAAAAIAIADEVVTQAASVSLVDADSAYMEGIVASVTRGMLTGRPETSDTAADYEDIALSIAAASKSLANGTP